MQILHLWSPQFPAAALLCPRSLEAALGSAVHFITISSWELFPPHLLLLGSTLPCEDVELEELEAQLSHASSWRQEQLLWGGVLLRFCILICPQQPPPFPKNEQGNAGRSSATVLVFSKDWFKNYLCHHPLQWVLILNKNGMNWKSELLIKSGILVHEWHTEPIWLIKRNVKIYLLLVC